MDLVRGTISERGTRFSTGSFVARSKLQRATMLGFVCCHVGLMMLSCHDWTVSWHDDGDTHNLYQQEFLNSTAQGSIPPHILKVKKGAPLMLLQNIHARYGMCNGTRLLCRDLFKNMLDVEILTENNAGKEHSSPELN
ncbi:PIF1-like helicase [Medicago truncatula]|uniref:PIF1-like helicase n=1 Tax=Medicago truncatula TaxID=3880 RepID=G7LAZ4_MEDTR|nr:PIF1-like helicase [Medicago truncatula]